jgi:hypothetical protein
MVRPHEDIIRMLSGQYGLDADLVQAIVIHESEGDCYRPRYEPQIPDSRLWNVQEWASQRRISRATESALQRMSWGPGQILGSTARWQGFDGDIPRLCDPLTSLPFVCKYLKWISQRPQAGSESFLIAAYNAGAGVKKTPGGMWMNQASYVDPVSLVLRQLRAIL